ncbi:MAG: NGG1p interacting factor NIF3 [Acidobacteria bacterium]|nr:NGG1p interacting factor NIF3 [Acidobacteriota bacterium]
MKLADIYRIAVQAGRDADPRGAARIEKELAAAKKEQDELKEKDQPFFDAERLTNPYADTRILNGDPETEVRTVIVGIDMEVGEILLADRLREKRSLDLVLTHHPEGRALAKLGDVMGMQADILNAFGVPIATAEGILAGRIAEVSRRLLPVNHTRAVDAARLLGLPFMCVHTPGDNNVVAHLQAIFDAKKPDTVGEVADLLLEIPEYRHSAGLGVPPRVVAGAEKNRAGRVLVDMTGGTEGSKEVFEKLARTDVGTVVCMHLSEEHIKEAEKHHVNAVIAGHIASDNLGINLVLDAVEKHGPLEILEASGFKRVKRS